MLAVSALEAEFKSRHGTVVFLNITWKKRERSTTVGYNNLQTKKGHLIIEKRRAVNLEEKEV